MDGLRIELIADKAKRDIDDALQAKLAAIPQYSTASTGALKNASKRLANEIKNQAAYQKAGIDILLHELLAYLEEDNKDE